MGVRPEGRWLAAGKDGGTLLQERRDSLAIIFGEAEAAHLIALEVELLIEAAVSSCCG